MDGLRSPRLDRTSLDVYLDAMGEHARLDADSERAQARRVVALRRDYWRALVSCPSRLDSVLQIIASVEDTEVTAAAEGALNAVRALQRSPSDARAAKLATTCEELAQRLTSAGVDPGIADGLMRLEILDGDREAVTRWRTRALQARQSYRAARDRFVCANLRLVVALANRYGRHHMPLADRVQEGNLGLLKAVDRFDPERGVRFSTYAAWWIRHAITRALTNHGRVVRVPAHVQSIFTKMRGARLRLRASLGHEPTDAQLADAVGVELTKLRWVRDAMEMRAVALDEPMAGSELATNEALAEDEVPDVGERLDHERNHTLATLALSALDAKERDILHRRFGLGDLDETTLQTLGERYGVSRERVRQLQNRALEKLRRVVESSPTPSCAFAAA